MRLIEQNHGPENMNAEDLFRYMLKNDQTESHQIICLEKTCDLASVEISFQLPSAQPPEAISCASDNDIS